MKELVVISGKGGTGKTSVVAAFAALAQNKVMADCDVDAADLHLVLEPTVREQGEFRSSKLASITPDKCTGCGKCRELCRFGAIDCAETEGAGPGVYSVDPVACEGCGVCVWNCPASAISFEIQVNGRWFVSDTRHGPLAHAKLGVAEENSGKLVTLVRNRASRIAEREALGLMLIDGAPGIGCPVIASIAGTSLALVVTEPTVSGSHDMRRVRELTKHFGVPTVVCVNKHDLNTEMAGRIEEEAKQAGAKVVGRIRYDPAVTQAQLVGKSIVEYTNDGVAQDVRALWANVAHELWA